jgi:hypothetical protein
MGYHDQKKMKQVLLAINGDTPTNTVFTYAIDLCARIQTELYILQFVDKKKWTKCLVSAQTRGRHLNRRMENSFAGVAFAEEGLFRMADEIMSGVSSPLKDLLALNHGPVPVKVALSQGCPETDLSPYIEEHQNIILTIFDPSKNVTGRSGKTREIIQQIKRNLCVPLVVVKP